MSSNNSFPYNSHPVPTENPAQYKPSLPSHNINQTFHQQPLAGGYVRPEYVAPQNWAPYSTSQHAYALQQTSGGSGSVDGGSGRSDGMVPSSQAQVRTTAAPTTMPPAHQNQNGIGARQVSGAGTGGYDYVTAYSHESNYAQVSSAPSTSADSLQSQFRTAAPSSQQYFNYSNIPQHAAASYVPAYQGATPTTPTHISQTHQTQPRVTKPGLQQSRSQTSRSSVQAPEKPASTYASYQSTHNTAPPQQQPLFSTTQNHSLLSAAVGQPAINKPHDSSAQSTPTTRSATPEVSYSAGPSYQKTNVQAASQQPLSMLRTQLPTGSGRQNPVIGSSTQSGDREDLFRAIRPPRGNGESMQNTMDVQDQQNNAPNYARTLQEQHQEYQYQQQAQNQAEARAQAQARAKAEARAEERAQAEAKAQAVTKAQAEALAQAEARARAEAQARIQAQEQADREAQAQLQAQAPKNSQATKKPRKQSQGKTKQQKSSYQSLDQPQVNQQYQQYQQQHQQQSQQRDYHQPQHYRYYQPPAQQTAQQTAGTDNQNNQQQLETCAHATPFRDAATHLPPLAGYRSEPEHHEARISQQRPETHTTSHPQNQNSTANSSQHPPQYQYEPHQAPRHGSPLQKTTHNSHPQPVSQPPLQQSSHYHSPPEPQHPPQGQQRQHLPHSTSQTHETPEPSPANLGSIDPAILEQQMRDMVERMRYYQSQDPHTFQAVWDSVRKSNSNANAIAGGGDDGHPKAIMPNTSSSQHRISNVSSPPSISSPLVRPVSVAPIDRRTVGEDAPPQPPQSEVYEGYRNRTSNNHDVSPIIDNQPPFELAQQNYSVHRQPEQLPQPPQVVAQSIPSDQVPTVPPPNSSPNTPFVSRAISTRDTQAPSNNTNKHGWDIGQKKRVARAVASYLCSTSGSVISEEAVMELLDKNNHFVSLCEKLESRGFKFDRGVFARKLLQETSGARMGGPKVKHRERYNGGARVLGEVDDKQEKDIQEKQQQAVKPSLVVKLSLTPSVISTSANTGTPTQQQSSPGVTNEILSRSPAPPPTGQSSTHSPSTTASTKTPSQTGTSATAPRGRGRPRKHPIGTNSGPPKTPAAQIIQQSSLPTPPVTVTSNSQDNSLPSITSSPLSTPTSAPLLNQNSQRHSRSVGSERDSIAEIPRNPTPQSVRAAYTAPPPLPYKPPGHRRDPQFVTPSLVFRTPTPPVSTIHPTPPATTTTTTATATFEPNHLNSFPSKMVPSNSIVDSSPGSQKADHNPAEHNESGDSREETGASAGPCDKQKSLVVKLPLQKSSQPKVRKPTVPCAESAPVIDLTDPTPEPQSINSSPNPEPATTILREAQKTKQNSPEPSVMPAKTPKPEIILAEHPVSYIRRSAVGRRSSYDPGTIATDLHRTIGRHPTLPALNSGLEVLKDNLPNYFSGPVDLTTIRWDVLDPPPPFAHGDETEDEAETLDRSLGTVGVGGGLAGVVSSPAPAPRKRGRKKKADVASSLPGPVLPASTSIPFPRPRGGPRKGMSKTPIKSTKTSNASGDTGGPSNNASFTQPTSASVDGAGSSGEGPPSRVGSSEAGGRQRASAGASGLRNVSTPSGSNIVVLVPAISGASKSEYLATPSSDRKRKSEERAEGGRAGKTPKLSVKPHSQKSNRPEPSGFKIFECRWKYCRARLHNFETLRKHVFKAHKKLTTYGAYACLWASCHREPPEEMKRRAVELAETLPDKISHDFKTGEEWEAHIDEKHLAQVKEELGLGPAVLPSDYESGISDVDYMSDRDGHPVTPLAVLAPPGYRFTPPPGFPVNPQFRLAHGLPTPPARRRRIAAGREGALGVVRNLAAGSSDPEKPGDDDGEGWKTDQIPAVEEEDVQMKEGN